MIRVSAKILDQTQIDLKQNKKSREAYKKKAQAVEEKSSSEDEDGILSISSRESKHKSLTVIPEDSREGLAEQKIFLSVSISDEG